jgi:hypothetical protein
LEQLVELRGIELEPNCGRERSGSPQAKSRVAATAKDLLASMI